MKHTTYIKLAVAALAAGLSAPMAASACELDRPIKLADGNWDAIQILNSIAAKILKSGYDCQVEMVTGAMVPLFAAVQKDDVDIFMDIWPSNNAEIWAKTLDSGAIDLGVIYSDAAEGWYVPRYLVDGDSSRGIEAAAPELKSVADLPKYKDLFADPEQPGMGRFLNCPIGWGCEQSNNTKLEEYGLLQTFTNFKTGSGAALDAAFASANKRGKPIVGYYWEPTWIMGLYDMIKLEEPACDGANVGACAFPLAKAHVAGSAKFVDQADALETFFRGLKTNSKEISQMLAYMQENEGSNRDDAALNFLKTQEVTWSEWVPAEVATKVKAGL